MRSGKTEDLDACPKVVKAPPVVEDVYKLWGIAEPPEAKQRKLAEHLSIESSDVEVVGVATACEAPHTAEAGAKDMVMEAEAEVAHFLLFFFSFSVLCLLSF